MNWLGFFKAKYVYLHDRLIELAFEAAKFRVWIKWHWQVIGFETKYLTIKINAKLPNIKWGRQIAWRNLLVWRRSSLLVPDAGGYYKKFNNKLTRVSHETMPNYAFKSFWDMASNKLIWNKEQFRDMEREGHVMLTHREAEQVAKKNREHKKKMLSLDSRKRMEQDYIKLKKGYSFVQNFEKELHTQP